MQILTNNAKWISKVVVPMVVGGKNFWHKAWAETRDALQPAMHRAVLHSENCSTFCTICHISSDFHVRREKKKAAYEPRKKSTLHVNTKKF